MSACETAYCYQFRLLDLKRLAVAIEGLEGSRRFVPSGPGGIFRRQPAVKEPRECSRWILVFKTHYAPEAAREARAFNLSVGSCRPCLVGGTMIRSVSPAGAIFVWRSFDRWLHSRGSSADRLPSLRPSGLGIQTFSFGGILRTGGMSGGCFLLGRDGLHSGVEIARKGLRLGGGAGESSACPRLIPPFIITQCSVRSIVNHGFVLNFGTKFTRISAELCAGCGASLMQLVVLRIMRMFLWRC